IQEDDTIVEQTCSQNNNTVKLLIDSMSIQYLEGAEIDFSTGLQEEFIIRNPNAKTTCGCGSSFTVDEE
ncbi:MAG: iron-sulfur cluster insertion protein, partial [Pseudomonadota bacterium]|nr:iron-sulfur cluster insertion protein [Pseudomonadota bacterium]